MRWNAPASNGSSTVGAQPGATPVVPCAQAMTGMPSARSRGTTTKPLATAGRPSSRVVV